MALRKCKECGRAVSSKAAQCPGCGAPLKAKGISTGVGCLIILIVVVIGVAWAGVAASRYSQTPEGKALASRRAAEQEAREQAALREAEQAQKQRVQREADLRANAPTLSVGAVVSYYSANEVAGDEALKGKWFKVKGVVERVGKDILGSSYIAFKNEEDAVRSVQCFFEDSHKSVLIAIQPGQQLTVFGKGQGLMMNVLMEKCEIVPNE